MPSEPSSTTGPLVTTSNRAYKTSDIRNVDLHPEQTVDAPSRPSAEMSPPRTSHPKTSRGAIPKSSKTCTQTSATTIKVSLPANAVEDLDSEISDDPHLLAFLQHGLMKKVPVCFVSRSIIWVSRALVSNLKMTRRAASMYLQQET